jgi:membrane protein DedA with SNARE-associated domain
MGLTWLVCIPLGIISANGARFALLWGQLSGALILSIIAFICGVLVWWVAIWVIKQKGRSLFHLFWLLVPFGFIVLLVLKNLKKGEADEGA